MTYIVHVFELKNRNIFKQTVALKVIIFHCEETIALYTNHSLVLTPHC